MKYITLTGKETGEPAIFPLDLLYGSVILKPDDGSKGSLVMLPIPVKLHFSAIESQQEILALIERAERGIEPQRTAGEIADSIIRIAWLHGKWNWFEQQMTDEERKFARAAIDRTCVSMGDEPVFARAEQGEDE